MYGLEVEGLETDRPALESVEQIAAFLIGHLRRVQPNEPYALLGYSFGDTVAFEMARQLHAAGERVQLLGNLDSFATNIFPQKLVAARLAVHVRRFILKGPPYLRVRLKRRSMMLRDGCSNPPSMVAEPTDVSETIASALRRVRQLSDRADRAYVPRRYDGVITRFQATHRPAHLDFIRAPV